MIKLTNYQKDPIYVNPERVAWIMGGRAATGENGSLIWFSGMDEDCMFVMEEPEKVVEKMGERWVSTSPCSNRS